LSGVVFKMTKQWHGGKGSARRNANDKAYADNWDKIFGKKSDSQRLKEQLQEQKKVKHDKQ